MKIRLGLVALGTAGAMALSGCAGSPSSSGAAAADHANAANAAEIYAKYDGMSGDERMTDLVKAAQKEGVLSLYTTLTPDSSVAVQKAFEEAYDIKVELYRASSEDIITRVQSEQKAGYEKGNDVLELNGLEISALAKDGFLADFGGPERDLVIREGQRDGWTADRLNRFVAARNTKLIKDGDWPKRLEDFADPKYKGKLSLEVGDTDWFMTLHDYYTEQKGMSEEDFTALFKKIAANSKAVDGHAPQIEQLSAGQFGAALATYDYQTAGAAADGAPVGYDPVVQPIVQRPNGVALMKSAPHPAAAYLFYVWILTDGQKVLRDAGLTSSLAADDANTGLDAGTELLTVDIDKLLSENQKYADMYDSLFH